EREMGLVGESKEDHGILILPPGTAKPGTPLRDAVPAVHDWIYELDLTPNRPDALGHVGLARDAAAVLRRRATPGATPGQAGLRPGPHFVPPHSEAPVRVTGGSLLDMVSVTIEDTSRCPHYGAAMVVDVSIAPSPLWLRCRLESLGVRAISNVV